MKVSILIEHSEILLSFVIASPKIRKITKDIGSTWPGLWVQIFKRPDELQRLRVLGAVPCIFLTKTYFRSNLYA